MLGRISFSVVFALLYLAAWALGDSYFKISYQIQRIPFIQDANLNVVNSKHVKADAVSSLQFSAGTVAAAAAASGTSSVSYSGTSTVSTSTSTSATSLTDASDTFVNQYVNYLISAFIGSNNQNITLLLDTGSSDLWVKQSNATCAIKSFSSGSTATQTLTCNDYDNFSTGSSSSYQNLNIAYEGESTQWFQTNNSITLGVWGQDTIIIDRWTMPRFPFGVVNQTDSYYGVLGIGLPDNSSNITYLSNLPARLKMGGIIEKMVYSMYQLSQNSTMGEVLFGAVDYSKFTGELVTVPITSSLEDSMYLPKSRIEVILNNMILSNGEKQVNVLTNAYPAVLDSSTELMQVPRMIANNLKHILNADNSSSAYVIKCPTDSSLTLNFDFSGSSVNIPVLSLVTSRYAGNCTLGIIPQDQGDYIILGRTFLKSAYVVYDLDDREVSLAARNFTNSALSSIVVITSLIASAVDAPEYSSTSLMSVSSEAKATATLKYSKLLIGASYQLDLSMKIAVAVVITVCILVM